MAGLDHRAAPPTDDDHGPAAARRARLGLILFAFYLVLYGGFVLLNAFAPAWMEQTPLFGVNLAVLYGLALIVSAFVLALVYDWLCRDPKAGEGGS
jgi:uncharacterized membrane protein (DUF485 family)